MRKIEIKQEQEYPTDLNCPKCNHPTVYEFDLEVCYYCGWTELEKGKEIEE